MTRAQRIGDLYASDATVKGGVRYTASGLEIDNGSVITAGQHSASVRLTRGGQVRICPGTNLTVNSSPKGQELMFAMSAGSLESEYDLPATADAILTPDFRILISGPAKVDVSITARPNGDASAMTVVKRIFQGDRILFELATRQGATVRCSMPNLESWRDIAAGAEIGARFRECRAIPAG